MAPLFTSRTIKIFFLIISTRIPFVHFVKQFCPHYFEKHSPVLQIIDVSLVPWKCVSLRALVRFLLLLLFNYELLRSGRAPWRRKWQPTPVFLPGKSHGHRSLGATVHGVTKSWTSLSNWTAYTIVQFCKPASHGMNFKLKHLLNLVNFSSQETSWRSPWNSCRKEEINTPKIQDFNPFTYSIKETWILTRRRWFFGTLVYHLLGLLDFWIKSLFLALTSHLSIYWLVQCVGQAWMRLHDVKLTWFVLHTTKSYASMDTHL